MRQATARALGLEASPGRPAGCPEAPKLGMVLGRPNASSAPLDGWDWLCCEPAETDLDEASGPGTGNLAGHRFQNLQEGPESRVAAGLIERAAQEAADSADGLEVLPVDCPQGSTDLAAYEASCASCFSLDEGPGSGSLCPSGAFQRGFLAAGLQPSGTFASRGAGLLSQARARARAFALLPGFGLGLRRSPLPRRMAESGRSEVLL